MREAEAAIAALRDTMKASPGRLTWIKRLSAQSFAISDSHNREAQSENDREPDPPHGHLGVDGLREV